MAQRKGDNVGELLAGHALTDRLCVGLMLGCMVRWCFFMATALRRMTTTNASTATITVTHQGMVSKNKVVAMTAMSCAVYFTLPP